MNGFDMLLVLQGFRETGGAFLLEFFKKMTYLGEMTTVRALLAIIYWCIWKELGTYLLIGWSGIRLANGALKVTFCKYRPWIQDPRITPDPSALPTATGYSFPSGHSTNAACVFGGTMIYKNIPWLLRIICALTLGLVCFSRSFLGVHFPYDVFMGAGSGLIIMVLTSFLLKWVDRHPNLDWIVVVCGLILCVGIALYAAFKSYPVDYDAEGNILADGAKMAADTFKGCGLGAGILVGWLLERSTVGFSTDIEASERITRAIVGIFFYYVLTLILLPPVVFIPPDPFGIVATNFVAMLYIMWLFPWAISKYEERGGAKTPARAAGHFKTA